MDDKLKNQILITTVAVCWAFMGWWWLVSHGGLAGLIMSLIVAAVVGAGAWFAVLLLG